MNCSECNQVFRLYADIAARVEAVSGGAGSAAATAQVDRVLRLRGNTVALLAHHLRCTVQQDYIQRIIEDIGNRPTHAHLVVDYRVCVCIPGCVRMHPYTCSRCWWLFRVHIRQQKVEEKRYRELQQQYFGKRGISCHGAMVYVSRQARTTLASPEDFERATKPAGPWLPYQTYCFDDVVGNNQCQDTVAVASLFEALIVRLKTAFPDVTSVSIQSDNGASYASPFLLFMVQLICRKHAIKPTEYVHNESGDGKMTLDAHFGVMTRLIDAFVNCGNDVTTPEQLVAALTAKDAANTVVSLVDFDLERLKEMEAAMATCSVKNSSMVRSAVFDDADGIYVTRHSGVTTPALIPQSYIDRTVAALPDRGEDMTITGVAWKGNARPGRVIPSTAPANWNRRVLAEGPTTVVGRAMELALAYAPHITAVPLCAMRPADDAASVPRLDFGWACASRRAAQSVSEDIRAHIRTWFKEGEACASAKCSAAVAISRLRAMRDEDGAAVFDDDDIPTEQWIKSTYSALARAARAKTGVTGDV
jgi:hypothetical protein